MLHEAAKRCMRCGNCQAVCPLYRATKLEPLVARGKIFLIRSWLTGALSREEVKKYLFLCLACKACAESCPTGVPYEELLLEARERVFREGGLALVPRLGLRLLESPALFALLLRVGRLGGRLAGRRTPEGLVLWEFLSARFGRKLVPLPAEESFRAWFRRHSPKGPRRARARVAYFPGCLVENFYPTVGKAVVKVLRHCGVDVVVPGGPSCCGFPALEFGDREGARRIARQVLFAYARWDVDFVVTSCPTCGGALKEMYPRLFAGKEGEAEAKVLAGRVRDISALLASELEFAPPARPGSRLAYHESCHLRRSLGVTREPRQLLASLADGGCLDLGSGCCGGAGVFGFLEPSLAASVGQEKVARFASSGAAALVTACPACITQFRELFARHEIKAPVFHVAEVLAAACEGKQA